jgi:hypothetical protein
MISIRLNDKKDCRKHITDSLITASDLTTKRVTEQRTGLQTQKHRVAEQLVLEGSATQKQHQHQHHRVLQHQQDANIAQRSHSLGHTSAGCQHGTEEATALDTHLQQDANMAPKKATALDTHLVLQPDADRT